MGGICEYCASKGYWECGEGARCVDAGDIDEDRCHDIVIIGKKHRGCLTAKLWLPELGPPPDGWKEWNRVPIRVETFHAGNDPVARVHVPECKATNKHCPDTDLRELVITAADVAVNIAVRVPPSSMKSADASDAK